MERHPLETEQPTAGPTGVPGGMAIARSRETKGVRQRNDPHEAPAHQHGRPRLKKIGAEFARTEGPWLHRDAVRFDERAHDCRFVLRDVETRPRHDLAVLAEDPPVVADENGQLIGRTTLPSGGASNQILSL